MSITEPVRGPSEWNLGKQSHGFGPWLDENDSPIPTDKKYDIDLLKNGDHRNVVDRYRYWTIEAIVADLDKKRHSFEVAIENLQNDANIGTIVRTANAFLAKKVHIVGKKRWNRRGAMVTDRYQHLEYQENAESLVGYAKKNNLILVVVDNTEDAKPLEQTQLPLNSLLLFGSEGNGVSDVALEQADLKVSIAQFGSTRSINVGVAAGIVMHQWIIQNS